MAPRLKVMVVDDDPTVLAVTRAFLEAMGHNVLVRDTALGTTAVILREKPDVVLLDVEMPALRGDRLMQLCRDRAEFNSVKFILYSGTHQDTIHEMAERCGAVGAIVKTGNHAVFAQCFDRLVAV